MELRCATQSLMQDRAFGVLPDSSRDRDALREDEEGSKPTPGACATGDQDEERTESNGEKKEEETSNVLVSPEGDDGHFAAVAILFYIT